MSEARPLIEVVRQWVRLAEGDLRNAENTLATLCDDCPYETVCYHAQQCVEKYLKAVLVFRAIPIPRSHSIADLMNCIPNELIIPGPQEDLDDLTSYATVTRYPGEYLAITRTIAEESVRLAGVVRDAVRTHLPAGSL